MELLENISTEELNRIKKIVGEAFITNELFHEFGDVYERRALVMKYMDIYVDYVYQIKALYATEDGNAFIGIAYSDQEPLLPTIKMLSGLIKNIPFSVLKKYMHHVNQISDSNKIYAGKLHVDILMVCVSSKYQGKGYTRKLVEFAKEKAAIRKIPLLFDTDMERYAKIYQHYGCELYNKKIADNGVVRYNLVWNNYDS